MTARGVSTMGGRVRVTQSGPRLPFRVPIIPWWVAVPAMFAVVMAMSVVAVVAVVS